MKRILTLILLFLLTTFTLCSKALAEDVFKITSANFDTSNSVIVLTALDGTASQIMPDLKLIKMDNPKRAYFDINSAILTIPKQDWSFNSQGIKQIKVSQFSTNPNVVRVVMYFDDDYTISNIKFLRIKNNIVLHFKNSLCQNDYYQNTYRDEHSSSSDFYEYLTVTTPTIKQNTAQDDIAGQIQQAFNTTVQQASQILTAAEKKELRLNTKYYIDKITPKNNAVLFNGFGSVTLEKPMILTNPSRIVFDMPNTLASMDIRNKEFKINDTDSVKVGQFAVNKARVVIQTNNVEQYIPIYSSDNQSLLIANKDRIDKGTLYSNTGDMIAYANKKVDAQTNEMTLSFNHPVVHGLDRTNDKLILYLYNISKYNEYTFKNSFANTAFADASVTLLPNIGIRLTIPLEQNTLVSTYLGSDGKTLKITTKAPKKTASQKPAAAAGGGITVPVVVPAGKRRVVIDAGHGGTDYGAIRDNTNEKDITLDVSKKVEDLLKKQGYVVLMTRPADTFVSLADRVAMAEQFNPDIFVSIHVNSSVRPEITGIETHYYHQESLNLAQTVHSSLASAIQSKNRGLFKSKFYVINHTTSPAILVEIGFISNDNERAQLVSEKRKQATAKAIAEGVNNYFKQLK